MTDSASMSSPNSGFISRGTIADRVRDLGTEIRAHYEHKEEPLVIVGLLKGAFIFMADLVRHIHHPLSVDFMIVSSYGNEQKSSGWVKLKYTPTDLQDKHILVVDDILHTGTTLRRVCQILQDQRPKSLEACVLLNRNTDAGRLLHPLFVGFNLTHTGFLVGYGLDDAEGKRNLPYIMRL